MNSLHQNTQKFVDILFGGGFYPLITKPSRITESSATLIDNIFTNDIKRLNRAGLLISDVSDHLPVFVCSEERIERKKASVYQYNRIINKDSIAELYTSLQKRDWFEVQNCTDVNQAYSTFIE